MSELITALAFASALTALFTFRYSVPAWAVALYFVGFAALDYVVQGLILPPGTFPDELAWVLFAIAALFVVAGVIRRRFSPPGEGEL